MPFKQGQVAQYDHVLSFFVNNERIRSEAWVFAELIVRVATSDKKAFDPSNPWQAVQVHRPAHLSAPPFALTQEFRAAFREAALAYGMTKLMSAESLVPPKPLLDDIAARLGDN